MVEGLAGLEVGLVEVVGKADEEVAKAEAVKEVVVTEVAMVVMAAKVGLEEEEGVAGKGSH